MKYVNGTGLSDLAEHTGRESGRLQVGDSHMVENGSKT